MIFHVSVIWDVLTYFWLCFCLINDFFCEIFWFALVMQSIEIWYFLYFHSRRNDDWELHSIKCNWIPSRIREKPYQSIVCKHLWLVMETHHSTGSDCQIVREAQISKSGTQLITICENSLIGCMCNFFMCEIAIWRKVLQGMENFGFFVNLTKFSKI
jgi:hypothetical protein